MKAYTITVNGVPYQVTVEETQPGQFTAPVPMVMPVPVQAPVAPVAPIAPIATGAAAPAPVPVPTPNSEASASDFNLESPLPGTVLSIKVKVGDKVTKNTLVAVIEAMKMENEILAAADGKITAIHVTNGALINAGDLLISIGK